MHQTREKSTRSTTGARVAVADTPAPVEAAQAPDTPAPDSEPEPGWLPLLADFERRRPPEKAWVRVLFNLAGITGAAQHTAWLLYSFAEPDGLIDTRKWAKDKRRPPTIRRLIVTHGGPSMATVGRNLAELREVGLFRSRRLWPGGPLIGEMAILARFRHRRTAAPKPPTSAHSEQTPLLTVSRRTEVQGMSDQGRAPRAEPALQQPHSTTRQDRARESEPRHVCECGHSWPASYGPTCNGCFKPITEPPTPQTRREVERAGRTHYARKVIAGRQEQETDRAPEKLISAIRARSAEHDVTFLEADVRRRIAAGKLTTADLLEYLNEKLPPRVNHASNESDPAHQRFLSDDAAGRTDRSRKGGYPAPPDDPRFTTPYNPGDDA